ncbi:Nucleotide-binding, alpha-beta plait [Akanthomyces lecanii RCEF 1005]|uniref:Nucleotide-binding, alpha-beta plait n=1 Tax=Akanthomyces lecanii RCEF 1005 TaxID=1081108 RepID=A0A168KR99_CORDF|nr:Nucleotide-binding, alpha-beta plait [Akanthomyces lecanii RCEF 1005]
MTDQQEPEIHATAAGLSPVSPCPVHTAAPLVVPALQDTVDTIEAMVAAVAEAPATVVDAVANPTNEAAQDDFVDDDSFDEAYAEDSEPQLPALADPGVQDPNDDYAKMFDSPVGSDQEEEDQNASVDVSAAPNSAVNQAQPMQAQNDAASSSVSASGSHNSQSTPDAPASQPAAQTHAGHDANVQALEATKAAEAPPADIHHEAQPFAQDEPSSDLNSHPDNSHVTANPAATHPDSKSTTTNGDASPTTLASTSSLPPRPPILHPAAHLYSQISVQGSLQAPQASSSAPGTSIEAAGSLPPPPQAGNGNSAPSSVHTASTPAAQGHDEYQHLWDQFMADERQYMSEAKWDRFPEGSRLFIGNLSSDKVSKRDVFELFHRYGRLAQISLKSAYGFVQYHTVEEGNRAVQNLEGVEIKGRRIHLEVSKLQDKSKKDRNKSPDRGGRGREGPRKGDKHHDRDDRRGGRRHSPRRQGYHGRDDSYGGRDKFYDAGGRGRDRSRSPGYPRHDKGGYRRRSNSPYGGRSRHQEKEIDLPRRYGADVPDIQIILQQEVNRDFVGWVEHAFKEKGLRPEVMFLHPRFPKDQVIQRQAVEGVHAVVELDMRAQNLGKIPVQVFDRSGGSNNVRFDLYVDLDPATAGEVILRAKAAGSAAVTYTQQPYGGYQQPYQPPPQQHPPRGGPYGNPPPNHAPPHAAYGQPVAATPVPNMADIAKLVGQVDNATLQRLLSSMAAPVSNAMPAAAAPPTGNAHVDIHALLGALGGNPTAQAHPAVPAAPHYGGPYGAGQGPPPGPPPPGGATNGDSAAVQNIMAQLSRYRR